MRTILLSVIAVLSLMFQHSETFSTRPLTSQPPPSFSTVGPTQSGPHTFSTGQITTSGTTGTGTTTTRTSPATFSTGTLSSGTSGTTTTIPISCVCQCIDILIVIDSSESITLSTFEQVRNFASFLVLKYPVSQTNVRFALLQFDEVIESKFAFAQYSTAEDVSYQISCLRYRTGLSNADMVLEYATQMFANSGRTGYRALLYFSDGRHTQGPSPKARADALRANYNVQIESIGIPGINGMQQKDYQELVDIAGSPGLVLNVTDISKLPDQLSSINTLLPCDCNSPCS